MKRWLIVTKEKDYDNPNIPNDWIDLEEKKELTFIVDKRLNKKDKVLIYKSGQWRVLSHIFEVKNTPHKKNGKYEVHLHRKKEIYKPIALKELKDNKIIRKNLKFKKRLYELPICCWSKLIGIITKNNPKLLDPHVPKFCNGPLKDGYPLKLKDGLIKLIKDVKTYDTNSLNEEATKYTIILPILEKLGWNIHDPSEIYPEDIISDRKVDYITKDFESNKFCIETKYAGENDLNQHKKQIIWYCSSHNVDMGILTNGLIWKFYFINYYENSLGAIKKIKTKEINLLKETPEKCFKKFIEYFWIGKTSENEPIKFKKIDELIEQVDTYHKFNESAVKQFILMPLLKNLGWAINDPLEIIYDKTINHKKVDYILAPYSTNNFIIEVKAFGYNLDIAESNLLHYSLKGKFKMSVLTNGKEWRFFYIKNKKNFAHKQYYGEYKLKIENLNYKYLIKSFHKLLSKENVLEGNHLKYLEKLV